MNKIKTAEEVEHFANKMDDFLTKPFISASDIGKMFKMVDGRKAFLYNVFEGYCRFAIVGGCEVKVCFDGRSPGGGQMIDPEYPPVLMNWFGYEETFLLDVLKEAYDICLDFVAKVDNGEAKSKATYAKMKNLLAKRDKAGLNKLVGKPFYHDA